MISREIKWLFKDKHHTGRSERSKNITHKRKRVKQYKMIDNSAIPFIANIYPSHIEIYSQKI